MTMFAVTARGDHRRQALRVRDALRFFSTAANPRIAGTNVWPSPAACARNSFHQSKLTPAGRRLRRQAGAQVLGQHPAQRERQRPREEKGHQPEPRDQRRCPASAPPRTPNALMRLTNASIDRCHVVIVRQTPASVSLCLCGPYKQPLTSGLHEERPRQHQILQPHHPLQRPLGGRFVALRRQRPAVVRVVDVEQQHAIGIDLAPSARATGRS